MYITFGYLYLINMALVVAWVIIRYEWELAAGQLWKCRFVFMKGK